MVQDDYLPASEPPVIPLKCSYLKGKVLSPANLHAKLVPRAVLRNYLKGSKAVPIHSR